ncbi:MAG: hypothetical protein ABUT39_08775 [Acidobacteriota bacterium]
MGAEQQLLEHLYDVLVLGKAPASIQPTPDELNPKFTPNQKFLQAAVAYTDAFILKAPGTDPAQAAKLAALVFQVQEKYGHHCVPHDPSQPGSGLGSTGAIETLTSSHAQLWHAGGAALLYAALQAGDAALIPAAQRWWRGEAALNHLTAWQTSWNLGSYQVIAPGARGGERNPPQGASPAAQNSTRDLDYEILLTGKLAKNPGSKIQDQYYTATLLLLKLTAGQLAALNAPGKGAPLSGPTRQGPWTTGDMPLLPAPLCVRRQGNQHSAWFQELSCLEPQLQAGVNAGAPWYKFYDDADPALKDGGESPWPPPETPAATVQDYGSGSS